MPYAMVTEGRHKRVWDSYDPNIYYEPEGLDTDIKAVNEEEENSDAEYVKMELSQARTLCQQMMNHKKSQKGSSGYIGQKDLKL